MAQLVIHKDDDDAHWETTIASDSPPIRWAESITNIELNEERSSIDHQERPFRLVGGLDVSPVLNSSPNKLKDLTLRNAKMKSDTRETAVACLIIMQTVSFDVVYKDTACVELEEPYVPFFLGFRYGTYARVLCHVCLHQSFDPHNPLLLVNHTPFYLFPTNTAERYRLTWTYLRKRKVQATHPTSSWWMVLVCSTHVNVVAPVI